MTDLDFELGAVPGGLDFELGEDEPPLPQLVGPVRFRLEIWNRTNTARLAIAGSLIRAEVRQVLKGEEQVTLQIPGSDPAGAELTTGAVLRLQGEGSATTFSLWRLAGTRMTRGVDDSLVLELTGDALWMDLRQGLVRQVLAGGRSLFAFGLVGLPPAAWLSDFVLPGYDGDAIGFQLGAVVPVDPVDLSFEHTSPLGALRALEEVTGGEVQFRLAADGQSYFVDLLTRIGTETGAELRYRKNLRGLSRAVDEADIQTRLYATGGGLLTLADAEWEVAGVGGVSGARILTFAGPHPVHEDGAHVGLWFHVPAKGSLPVTASDAAAGTLTVDDGGIVDIDVGDVGWIATDIGGTRLAYLESPAGRAAYGVRVGHLGATDVPDAINLVPNGDLSEVAAGLPAEWAKEGAPVVASTTDPLHAHQGGKAWQVTAAVDGEGLVSDPFDLTNPEDRPYTGMRVGLTVLSGKVRVELRHSDGTTYPVSERPSSEGLGVYLELTAGPVHDEPLPAGTAQLAVLAHGDAAEFVLDAAMVTPTIGEEVPAFVAGSGAHLLWDRAAAELADRRLPRVEYAVDVADLFRGDPDAFAFDELRLGDDVRIRDPEIARETQRIVETQYDVLRAETTRLALAPSPRLRLHDPLRPVLASLGGSRGGTAQPGLSQNRAAVLSHAPQFDGVDGKLYIGVLGNARTATLELFTKTSRTAAYPGVPVAVINGRQGTFPGQAVGPRVTLYYRIVPKDGRGVAGEAVEDAFNREGAAPTVRPRVVVGSVQTTADLFVTVESPLGEAVRLHVRDAETADAPTWSLVESGVDDTPRFVASGTEVGPGDWFHDGTSFSLRLNEIALGRDQVRRVSVQAEAQISLLRSTWVPVTLDLRGQPWLEGVDLVFDEAVDELKLTAVGGAHCQSASWQFSDDNFGSVAAAADAALADGQSVTQALGVLDADRGKEWRGRVIPFNGPFVDPTATGLAGVPQAASVFVPASPGGGIEPPAVEVVFLGTDPNNESLRFQWTDGTGGTGPYEYRWRTSVHGVTGAWQPNPPDGWADIVTQSHDEFVARDNRHPKRLELQVRYDAHPGIVGFAAHIVEARPDVPPEDPGDNDFGSGEDGTKRPGRDRPKME